MFTIFTVIIISKKTVVDINVDKIQLTTVQISWRDPVLASVEPVKYLWILLRQENVTIFNKVQESDKHKNNFIFIDLAPFTKYKGSIKLENNINFGEPVSFMFTTAEAGKKIFYETAMFVLLHRGK